jgi:hypothetical protein
MDDWYGMNRVRQRRLHKQSVFRLLPMTAALLFFCIHTSFATYSDSLFVCIPPSDTAVYCNDPALGQLGRLGTPAASKREVAVPGARDHVIGSYIKSGDLSTVQREAFRFGAEVIGLKPRIR